MIGFESRRSAHNSTRQALRIVDVESRLLKSMSRFCGNYYTGGPGRVKRQPKYVVSIIRVRTIHQRASNTWYKVP